MKKTIFLCLMAMSFCLGGFAQKGRQAVGIDVPFRLSEFDYPSLGIGVKYQYNVTDFVQLEPVFQYYFYTTDPGGYEFLGALNTNIFLLRPNRLRPYMALGIGCASAETRCDCGDLGCMNQDGGFFYQIGLGVDCRINYDWSCQLFCGFDGGVVDNLDPGLCVSIGTTYNF